MQNPSSAFTIFAQHDSNISQVITPSGRTITGCVVIEDGDLSVYHLCNASACLCQTLNC